MPRVPCPGWSALIAPAISSVLPYCRTGAGKTLSAPGIDVPGCGTISAWLEVDSPCRSSYRASHGRRSPGNPVSKHPYEELA